MKDFFFNVLCFLAVFAPFQFALNVAPGFDVAVLRVIIILLFVFVVAKSLADKKMIVPADQQSILLIAFFVVNIFSLFFANNLAFGIRKVLFLASIFPLYFILSFQLNNNQTDKRLIKFAKCLVWGGFLSFVFGFIVFLGQFVFGIDALIGFYGKIGPLFWGQSFSESVLNYQSFLVNVGGVDYFRIVSLFPDPHNFSLFVGMISFLSLALYVFFRENKKLTINFYGIISLMGFVAVFLSFSRAAYIALIASLLIFVALGFKNVFSQKIKRFLLLGAVFLAIIFSLSPIANRFSDIFSREDGSSIGRVQILKDGLDIFRENILFGVGIGNAPLYYNEDIEYRNPTNSHNTYLEIAIENGILGLFLWIGLILGMIVRLVAMSLRRVGDRQESTMVLGVVCALVFFAIHSLFEVFLYSPINLSVLMILMALGSVLLNWERFKKDNNI